MPTITFKGKIREMYNFDDTFAYKYIAIPELDRKHCDMHAFRTHSKYGSYANSDLFKGMLKRIKMEIFGSSYLQLDDIPNSVTVDTSGFLAVVTINVP